MNPYTGSPGVVGAVNVVSLTPDTAGRRFPGDRAGLPKPLVIPALAIAVARVPGGSAGVAHVDPEVDRCARRGRWDIRLVRPSRRR